MNHLTRVVLLWFPLLIFYLNPSGAFETSANGSLLRCGEDTPIPPYHTIDECHRKIRLTVDLYNTEKTPEGLEFIYVKEIANPVTGVSLKLLNPIVIRLRQTQVVLAYPFTYLSAVNGRATEIVVNYENKANYSGCDDTSSIHPTCGVRHVRGQAVPYSEGFCCYCPKTASNTKQVRGGQDCSLYADSEDDFEKQRFKASAHCLRFNDVWYTVSDLSDPLIIHDIFLQVYNQRFLTNGSTVWVSLTHDEEFGIGNKNPFQFDTNKTIVAMFYTSVPKNGTSFISSDRNRLLIPQPIPGVPIEKLPPPLTNGATDFLLLSNSVIDPTGESCDAAGVSYAAFAKQPDRCSVQKNTCLKNQPLDFWDADNKLRESGEKGKYLLENYNVPYKIPIISDKETKEHWLALEYYERQHTVVTIELNADDIVTLKPGKRAQISLVVTASFEKRLEFFVSVANKGLVLATFQVQVAKCGYWVPDSLVQLVTVPPQRLEEVKIVTRPGEITLAEAFSCFVFVNSTPYGVVASREVTVNPMGRCICNLHCECVCLGLRSLKCESMSVKDFHLAGFTGSLPLLTSKSSTRLWMNEHPLLALLAFILVLLLIGFMKAVFGYTGNLKIGHFGLKSLIYKPKKIKRYFEPQLRGNKVQYDVEGYPINPETSHPTSVLSEEIIFLLNILFFFVWPLKAIADCFRKRDKGSDATSEKSEGGFFHEDWETSDHKGTKSEGGFSDEDWETSDHKGTNFSEDKDSYIHNYNSSLESVNLQSDLPTETDPPSRPPSPEEQPLDSSDATDTGSPDRESAGSSDEEPNTEPILLNSSVTGLNSAVSDSVLEFVASRHEGELPLVSKELARWQKGTARINAFKVTSKSSFKVD